MESWPQSQLDARVGQACVFARVTPAQKLLLVDALKRRGEIVAMTGDGVNDAPALKSAHIGIAMGKRGTDVAREAASLVLLEDDFSAIVTAIALGRRIYANLRQALVYAIAVHVPTIGLSLLPVLMGWPPVLAPVHIAFLELVIDPACSVVFEAEPGEAGLMERPPRAAAEPLLSGRQLLLSLVFGLLATAVVCACYVWALEGGGRAGSCTDLDFCGAARGRHGPDPGGPFAPSGSGAPAGAPAEDRPAGAGAHPGRTRGRHRSAARGGPLFLPGAPRDRLDFRLCAGTGLAAAA